MTNNLKIEVLVSNIPEDGSIASQFPSQEYVNQQLAKKANLSPEGRLDPSHAPDYTEIPGLYEHIEDTKDAIEVSIADSLQDAKGYTNQQLSTSLQTKADLVNGKIPFDQIPFSADIEDQIQINVENITAVVDQKVAQVVEQVNGVATAANSYTDTKVAENKTYVDTTIGNVIEDVTTIVDTKAVSKAVTIPTYLTPEAGVTAGTGVAAGAYYNVRSTEDDTVLVEYQNVGGVPTPSGKIYPSGAALTEVKEAITEQLDINELQGLKNKDLVSVKDRGAKGDGIVDDSVAINAFVAEGEQTDKRYAYYYLPNFDESYLLNNPVKFRTGGVRIFGFRGASYNTGKGRKGNILVAGTHGFDLGDNRVVDPTHYTQTDGWTVSGLAFLQAPSVTAPKSVDAIRFTPATNGPDRGATLEHVSAIKMNRAVYVPKNAGVMLGTVVIERCNLSQNNYSFLSDGKIEGFRFVGNQAENNSTGGIDGYFNGACDISNNMLEGQPNAVKIRGYQVYATVSKNYFEANSGDFAVDFSATVDGSSLVLTDNVAYTLTAKDYCLIRGNEFDVPYHVVNGDRYAVTLLNNVSLAPTSKLINQTVGDFKVKIDTGDIGAKILNRTLSDAKQDPSYTSMWVRSNTVARYLDSPQGKVLAPIKNDYFATNMSAASGDVLAFNMLIKCVGDGSDSALYFQVFNSAITNIVTGTNTIRGITGRINNEYILATYFVRINTTTASVLTRIYHATFDVQMIACCVKNLGQLAVGSSLKANQVMPILNKDLMALVSNTSAAITIPADTQTVQTFTVDGASVGDIVHVGVSVYTPYLSITGYVSSSNIVTVLFVNNTASSMVLPQNSTFKIKIIK